MFEERRSNDLVELLKSVQVMVGNNGNTNGNHSKLSDFQRTKPPGFMQVANPMEADDWLRTIEINLILLAQKKVIRFHLQPTIWKEPRLFGGTILKPCGQQMKKLHGISSRKNSASTTSPLVS